jgi:hypothetical protein
MSRCKVCDRVQASDDQYNNIPKDETEHLCLGQWDRQQCYSQVVDWHEKYQDLLVNFKNLDKYNDVLYRCYHQVRRIRNSGYDGEFIGEVTKELFGAIASVERFEDELYATRKKEGADN